MKAFSLPIEDAEQILAGKHTLIVATWMTDHRGELTLMGVPSLKSTFYDGHSARAVCVVDLIDCRPMEPADEKACGVSRMAHSKVWEVARPRRGFGEWANFQYDRCGRFLYDLPLDPRQAPEPTAAERAAAEGLAAIVKATAGAGKPAQNITETITEPAPMLAPETSWRRRQPLAPAFPTWSPRRNPGSDPSCSPRRNRDCLEGCSDVAPQTFASSQAHRPHHDRRRRPPD